MSLEGFNKRLLNARREKGLTQNELAAKLGVTSQTVSKWERGNSYPDIDMLDHIAEILECSIDYLFQYNINIKFFKIIRQPRKKNKSIKLYGRIVL